MDQAHGRRGRRRLSALLTALAGVALIAAMVTIALWYRDGGRYQVVATPSMGTAAPVGTLVLTEPAPEYRLGDVITYQPPVPQPQDTKTHRIVRIEPGPDGPLSIARGDINGAEDPWKIPYRSVVGKAVFIAPGLGWLLRAIPLLALGGTAVWWGTKLLATRFWRVPLRVLGFSLLLATTTLVLKPFVATITRGITADATGMHITIISAGMLPIRVTSKYGGFVDLASGEIKALTTIPPPGARGAPLTAGVHMPWWLWLTMTGLWLLPLVYGLAAAIRRPLFDDAPGGSGPPGGRGPGGGDAAAAATAIVVVSALLVSHVARPTQAGYTAQVVNGADTAASAAYFTCGGAFPGVAGATGTTFVWPLDDTSVLTLSPARDASGNTRTGTYVNGFTSTTTPCSRDTPNRAVTLVPTATLPSYVATTANTAVASRNVFSEAIWFRTSTTTGGRLIGWGNLRTGPSTVYDRHLYMTDGGQIVFGVYPAAVRTIVSPAAYNDGRWHLAVATLSAAGAVLYLDGAQVAADPTITTAEGGTSNTGYWRVGWDSTGGWTSSPTTSYWAGSLGYAAVYSVALSAAQVRQLYVAGT